MLASSLSKLSKKELLAACQRLASEVGEVRAAQLIEAPVAAVRPNLVKQEDDAEGAAKQPAKKKLRKEFDFSRYPQKQVALWVGYFGEKYNGLATTNPNSEEDDLTIEWNLMRALKRTRLVDPNGDFESWGFSRCGRTDRGVSALGQVVSMRVRSTEGEEDLDYASMINNNLPNDILVLAWAPVNEGIEDPGSKQLPFNARFSCRARTYRYFFRPANLNLKNMQDACARFEGNHDFRNFCKIDLDNVKSFERRIDVCRIVSNSCLNSDVQFVEVKGSGFLWHQIRMIMAVLFHVGAELEEPSIVSDLLNIQKYPARPDFKMASDLPLLLYSADYDPGALNWRYSEKDLRRVISRLNERLGEDMFRLEMTKSFLDVVTSPPFPKVSGVSDIDLDDIAVQAKRERYKKFANRAMCKSVEERQQERQQQGK